MLLYLRESGLGTDKRDTERLASVLRGDYGFDVEVLTLGSSLNMRNLRVVLDAFTLKYDQPENLLLIYHTGDSIMRNSECMIGLQVQATVRLEELCV